LRGKATTSQTVSDGDRLDAMKTLARICLLLPILASCQSVLVPLVQGQDPSEPQSSQEAGLDTAIEPGANDQKTTPQRNQMVWLLGSRDLRSSDWDPVGRQGCLASEMAWLFKDSHWGIEAGFAATIAYDEEDTGTRYIAESGSTIEISFGPCYEIPLGASPLRVIAGLGPSRISAARSSDRNLNPSYPDDYDDDSAWGLYAHVSLAVEFGTFRLGVDVRTLNFTSITLFDNSTTADYTQVALLFGYDY
jgi:hypothetical protein